MVVVIALSSLCGITVCGAEMRYAYAASVSSRLSISGQTATCISTAVGNSTVTKLLLFSILKRKAAVSGTLLPTNLGVLRQTTIH